MVLNITALSIEGGGSRALAVAGALRALPLNNLKVIVGASSGAIVGAMLATGWSTQAIVEELVARVQESDILDMPSNTMLVRKLWMASQEYGINRGEKKFNWILSLLKRYTGKEYITFDELQIDLVVPVTCYTTHKLEILSRKTSPHLPVVSALMATTAVPGIFVPVRIRDEIYLDAGLMCNNPIRIIDQLYPEHVPTSVALVYDWQQEVEVNSVWNEQTSIASYFANIVHIPVRRISELENMLTRDIERRTLLLPTITGLATDDIDQITRAALARHGEHCAREYVRRRGQEVGDKNVQHVEHNGN